MLQKLLWRKGLRSVPPAQSPPASAVPREKGEETHPQPVRDHGCSQSLLGSCNSHHQPPGCFSWEVIYKYTTALLDGGPAGAAAEALPHWAVWPMGPCEHGVPFPGLPIQPFLLICPRLEPRAFPWHNPGSPCRPLLSC